MTPTVPTHSSSYSTEQLTYIQEHGFVRAATQAPQRLVINLAGPEKTGKTHLALTGRPPIYVFSLDIGTEGVIEKFSRSGIDVFLYEVKFERSAATGTEQQQQQIWLKQWEEFKAAIWTAYAMNPGTVIMDTWTEAYELCRLAHFGKLGAMPNQYPVVYSDLRGVVRWAYDHPTATTIFIHKMAKKYQSEQLEVKGFSDMDFLVQINIQNSRQDPEQPGTLPNFSTWIKDCRQNPFTNGYKLSGDQFSVQYLEWFVHSNWAGNGSI